MVLVYGDTNATLAGALAAAKLGVPVAHVEAGLRSFDRSMPEEINRVVTDHLADAAVLPDGDGGAQPGARGHHRGASRMVGDVMNDLALTSLTPATEAAALARFGLQRGRFIFATIHRPVNTDSPRRLAAISRRGVGARRAGLVALHPRTRRASRPGGWTAGSATTSSSPSPSVTSSPWRCRQRPRCRHRLRRRAEGGLRPRHAVHHAARPDRVGRDRPERLEHPRRRRPAAIAAALAAPPPPAARPPFYGDGHAGERIVAAVAAFLGA